MKVVCINDDWDKGDIPVFNNCPKINDIVTVTETFVMYNKVPVYILKEYPSYLWEQENFAPISEIDETEFERNYNKELV